MVSNAMVGVLLLLAGAGSLLLIAHIVREEKTMKRKMAFRLETLTEEWIGDAALYLMDPPYLGNQFVVVSAADIPPFVKETAIFASDASGDAVSWTYLDGTLTGVLSHEAVLKNVGYELVSEKQWMAGEHLR